MSTTADDTQRLLHRRSGRRLIEAIQKPTVPDVADVQRAALSSGQRRAWFLQTRDPDDTTLNIGIAYRLTGTLDTERLRAAVEAVAARHEILRTTYGLGDTGEPYRIVRNEPLSWQEHDLSGLPESSRTRRLEVLSRRELGRPFELATEAPIRITLIRTGAGEFVFVLVAHTIAWDDDSWGVFAAELNAAYHGAVLPEPRGQAVAADTDADAAAVEYWRDLLRPLPETLELPGRALSVDGARRTRRCSVPLSRELLARVDAFARESVSTPFAVLLAAFDAVIHRYTAATDFLVAVPVSTRGATAVSVIGYFGNTLLLRATLRSADTFANFAAAVREHCADAFAHREVGIDRVVHAVNPNRSGRRDGLEQLVRVGFGVTEREHGLALDGVTAARLELGSPAAPVPLRCTVVLDADGPRVEAQYWDDQLAPGLVERLIAHYVQLLDNALTEPGHRIGDIDIFGDDDRARLLAQSHGALVGTRPTTMVALFEQRVAAAPQALAIVAPRGDGPPDVELSYDQLNRRANRMAHWLIGQGIGAEDIVALRISTSVEFVVAALGVLKAGAAYLPIDPAYPDERIDLVDRDARPRLLLGRVEAVAAEESAIALPEHDPADADRVRPLRPGNLAYVIYTSGSTGRPKGVPVSHAAIADHLESFCAEWGMTAADRLLQSSSVSFDASLLDIFVTLTVGARLVIPKPGAFGDIAYVADLIARCGVTVLHMVPSMLSTFLLLPEVSEWRALRHVPVGGEALPGEVADRFAAVFDAELRNHYGPTEAVVSATHMRVEGPQGTRIVPIGTPNRNVYVYLLDERLQLVPAGVVGEIYLGGPQLARGYLNRCGLTAQRFIADPFCTGQRLYRTGDLARRTGDGVLEFIGRADEQVKIRGFRIELGEVEAVIASHPDVGHCVVVAVSDAALGMMLAAYVVPAGAAGPDLDRVRAHAAVSLPDYMVPSAFSVIDEIPLTRHGKLDKKALPEPVPAAGRDHREPRTANEMRVAELYAEIFGLSRVGADDSFFELGGHSLLANRLVSQLRAEFGVEIDVRVLFDTPTVAGLAALIEATPVALSDVLTAAERQRVLGEWATGVELSDVPQLPELIRRGRAIPGLRSAVRCGTQTLTYDELFAQLDAGSVVGGSTGVSVDRLVRLFGTLATAIRDPDAMVGAGSTTRLPTAAALAAAVWDRRVVAAESRCRRVDPAYGWVDVRLIAAEWSDAQVAVELLAALADGATLIVATPAQQANPGALVELIAAHAVTHVVATAASLSRIVPADGATLPTIRRWDVTGTDSAPTLPGRLAAVAPESVATFAYTVPACAGAVARGSLDGSGRARPIPGARILVLDESRQPVPPNVIGEVYVGGATLSIDAFAVDRSVDDPFLPGGRLFRTGDRARWTTDGWLIFG
ncbi:amino acid adenylation domain-containing protein [Nocardia sp. NBC_00565]|uniref:non-ribosomal peptide synthetase n=1 Tax=Nocardia sp. NBC_00565 TaxID=2975993 RepID=UPI002E81383D|nr:amino acid adenylation domain-containing protein [Nocardia sp. NBC_00565]WUC02821.1 amino acid adenylation domain-containing protein [Nocardia sp. NBC_00565]